MKEKNNTLEAISEWIKYDLPDNIPAMCFICTFVTSLALAIAILMIGCVIKILIRI